MNITNKLLIILNLLTLASFIDMQSAAERMPDRREQFTRYAQSLHDLNPYDPDDYQEYNNTRNNIILLLNKEVQKPSMEQKDTRERVYLGGTMYTYKADEPNPIMAWTPIALSTFFDLTVYKHHPTKPAGHAADPYEERNIMHLVAAKNDETLIERFHSLGANINQQSQTTFLVNQCGTNRGYPMYSCDEQKDNTPLHLALANNCSQAATKLIDLGARCDILNCANTTAFDMTAQDPAMRNHILEKNSWIHWNNSHAHAARSARQSWNNLQDTVITEYYCRYLDMPRPEQEVRVMTPDERRYGRRGIWHHLWTGKKY